MSTVALLLTVAAPAAAALLAAMAGAARGDLAGRIATLATGAAFLGALVLAALVVLEGPVSAVITGDAGGVVAGLSADRVAAVVLPLVLGVSLVVQSYARRYLRGDVRATRFFASAGLLTSATAAMVLAATLVGLAVAWSVAGLALCLLLAVYRGLPAADEGVRRAARAVIVGDVALWAAVALAVATWGNLDLRRLDEIAPALAADGAALTLVACLLVVAALARSAQIPFHGWLPATLGAPTPVSALLHAGVVNAGGVLLVTTSPLFGASSAAMHIAFAAGAVTAVYGTAVMLARPDVKGALAHSTVAQMGFMIMTCGLGAYAAAVFHLVAHGMYKASLFLGSGGAVRRHVRHLKAPPRGALSVATRTRIAALALAGPAVAIGVAASVLHPHVDGAGGTGALLLFAWVTAAWGAWGWMTRHPSPLAGVVLLPVLALAALAYVGALRGAAELLAPALGGAGDAEVGAWALAPVFALLAALAALRLPAAGRGADVLTQRLYVWALSAGDVRAPLARRMPPGPRRPRLVTGPLVARSEGGRP